MLIDLNKKKDTTGEDENGFQVIPSLSPLEFLNIVATKHLEKYFSNLNQGSYYYISNGKVSSYQLINFFLDKFNQPATVFITTWGMTELAIRNLATRKKAGQIEALYFVFSEQTKVNKANEYQLAVSVATGHKIMPCHAKIYLIKTKDHQISIISSANLNRNNKLEAGTITTDPSIYNGYSNFLLNEIYRGNIKIN